MDPVISNQEIMHDTHTIKKKKKKLTILFKHFFLLLQAKLAAGGKCWRSAAKLYLSKYINQMESDASKIQTYKALKLHMSLIESTLVLTNIWHNFI